MKSIDQRILERSEAQRIEEAAAAALQKKAREIADFHAINIQQSPMLDDATLNKRGDVIFLTRPGGQHLNIKALSETKFLIRHDASQSFDAMSFEGDPINENAMLDAVIAFLER